MYDEIVTQIAKQEDENGKMKEKKAMLEQELTRLEDVQEETTKQIQQIVNTDLFALQLKK